MGGPIQLAPNATRVLFEYGLKEVLEKNMILDTSGVSFRRYDTGKQSPSALREFQVLMLDFRMLYIRNCKGLC